MISILTQATVYEEEEVRRGLQQYDQNAEIEISKLIFYPYYFFEYEISVGGLLKLKGKTACTVDALSGHGALIDMTPEFSNRSIQSEQLPSIQINEEEAVKVAGNFIFQNASSKGKFLTVPKIKELGVTQFYRPFWLAEYAHKREGQSQQLIVDAVSGSYHPL